MRSNTCALGAALSLAAFTPALRAQCDREGIDQNPPVEPVQATNVVSLPKQVLQISPEELQSLIRQAVRDEFTKQQSNSLAVSRQDPAGRQTAPPMVKALHDADESVSRATGGWRLGTLFSATSTIAVAAMGTSIMAMPFLKRYPGEFEIKIADLRRRGRAGEEYGVEPLFGRTEVEALLGKPKAMSNRFLNYFLPERWALVRAQLRSRFRPEFPFMRFNDVDIFRAASNFLKVNASSNPLIKQSIRDAHFRLIEEVKQFDGKRQLYRMNPLSEGEEVISVMTYERWRTKINRILTIPTKDLCALLINPKRYYDEIIAKHGSLDSSESMQSLKKDLTGLLYKLKIAVALCDRSPDTLRRYLLPDYPRSWQELQTNTRMFRPLLVLHSSDAIAYCVRYFSGADSSLSAQKLREEYVQPASIAAMRPFGEVKNQETASLSKLWNKPATLTQTISYLRQELLYKLRLLFAEDASTVPGYLRLAPKPYVWFVETTFPDPRL